MWLDYNVHIVIIVFILVCADLVDTCYCIHALGVLLLCPYCVVTTNAALRSVLIIHGLKSLLNMTTYTVLLQPPAAFCFNHPDKWAKWKQCNASNSLDRHLDYQLNPKRQTSTLLYTLGDDSENVLFIMNISNDGRKKYLTVMEMLEKFFKIRMVHNGDQPEIYKTL